MSATPLSVELLAAAMQAALDKLLEHDPEGAAQFDALRGRSLMIEVEGTSLRLSLWVDADGHVLVSPKPIDKPSATLRGPLSALINLTNGNRDDAVFGHGVEFSGEIGVGNRFQDALKGIVIDWEGLLAQRVGDTAAHLLFKAMSQFGAWGREVAEDLPRDLAEYLREELRLFLGEDEMEPFLRGTLKIRTDVDRLEARIKLLERKLGETAP
ncbi:MAG: ubiquinone biosynthesis accessory factor UbiJ [Gammaproteobacteria bacterium]